MDGLKELVEAFSARIKSPIIGSIALAFVAVNWRPVFFLFFSGEPASDKFEYFANNTTGVSLLLLPVIVGLAFALIVPWINFWGAKAIESPVSRHRNMQLDAAHAMAEKKTRYAIDMEVISAEYRSALLKSAQVDQEIKEAQLDDDIGANLEKSLSESPVDRASSQHTVENLSGVMPVGAIELLEYLSEDDSGEFEYHDDGKKMSIFSSNGHLLESSGRKQYYTLVENFRELAKTDLVELDGKNGVINKSGYDFLASTEGKI